MISTAMARSARAGRNHESPSKVPSDGAALIDKAERVDRRLRSAVTWAMTDLNRVIGKLMTIFINTEKMVGDAFELVY